MKDVDLQKAVSTKTASNKGAKATKFLSKRSFQEHFCYIFETKKSFRFSIIYRPNGLSELKKIKTNKLLCFISIL